MTSANSTLRALFVYSLIIPLALVVGYLLATPTDFFSWAPIIFVLGFLALPLLLKWHRSLVFLTWSMTAVVFFLPGRPQVWIPIAFLSLIIAVVQRALVRDLKFIHAPSVIAPLICLAIVIYITGRFTGGFGLQSFGSSTIGGRRYFTMFAGMAGFLAMLAQPIPPAKARLYLGLFFLGALVDAIGNTITFVDPSFWYIYLFFPVDVLPTQADSAILRFTGGCLALMGLYWYLLARFGIREIMSGRQVLRGLGLFAVVVLTMLGGYRSYFILMALTFLLLFYFEGLVRTKYTAILVFSLILMSALIVPLADKLPLSVQRSLSVLPLDVNPAARMEAENSNEWRLQMWRVLWREDVPIYLWFGKGLAVNEQETTLAAMAPRSGTDLNYAAAMALGDYHSGPLTTIIPFGIWGMLAWLWFLAASIRALYYNHRYGEDYLKKINTFLLAYFTARTVYFFTVFGNLHSDLPVFMGIIGLGLALNGGIRKPVRVPNASRSAPNPLPARLRSVPEFARP